MLTLRAKSTRDNTGNQIFGSRIAQRFVVW